MQSAIPFLYLIFPETDNAFLHKIIEESILSGANSQASLLYNLTTLLSPFETLIILYKLSVYLFADLV